MEMKVLQRNYSTPIITVTARKTEDIITMSGNDDQFITDGLWED